jgi:hypothetical protein
VRGSLCSGATDTAVQAVVQTAQQDEMRGGLRMSGVGGGGGDWDQIGDAQAPIPTGLQREGKKQGQRGRGSLCSGRCHKPVVQEAAQCGIVAAPGHAQGREGRTQGSSGSPTYRMGYFSSCHGRREASAGCSGRVWADIAPKK